LLLRHRLRRLCNCLHLVAAHIGQAHLGHLVEIARLDTVRVDQGNITVIKAEYTQHLSLFTFSGGALGRTWI
jgi:hypothetical protein